MSLVRCARDPACASPAGQDSPAVVVRPRHPVQLRATGHTPESQLPLEVIPHHFLRRHLARPRPIPPRRQSLCLPRLFAIYRLSTALARLSPTHRCLVSIRPVFLSRGVHPLVSATRRPTAVGSLGGSRRRTTRTLGALSTAALREQFHREQQSNRRPARHQHRLPLQRRRSRHIRRQRHRDTKNDTAIPSRKASHTTARTRRSAPRAEFNRPTVASNKSPSTDNGHSVALTASAPPCRANARWCTYEAYAATDATTSAQPRRTHTSNPTPAPAPAPAPAFEEASRRSTDSSRGVSPGALTGSHSHDGAAGTPSAPPPSRKAPAHRGYETLQMLSVPPRGRSATLRVSAGQIGQ